MLRFWTLFSLLAVIASRPAATEGTGAGEISLLSLPLWQALDRALVEGRENSRVTLVFVHARGCGPCRLMENEVMPQVRLLLDQMALAKLDMADNSTRLVVNNAVLTPSGTARQLGMESTPGFVLVDPEGKPILRENGLLDVRAFGLFLAYGTTGAYRYGSFADYAIAMRGLPGEAAGGR